jgi:F0F1-type ATP synthase assembly protein I
MAPGDPDNESRSYGQGYEYFAMGFGFAFAILGFGALGWLVDGWLHTRPLFAIAGGFLGGFGGFMSIYYRVTSESAAEKKRRAAGSGER